MKKCIFNSILIFLIFSKCSTNDNKSELEFKKIEKILINYANLVRKDFPKLKEQNIVIERVDSADCIIFKGVFLDEKSFLHSKLNSIVYFSKAIDPDNYYLISFDKQIKKTNKYLKFKPYISGDFYSTGVKIIVKGDSINTKYISDFPELIWSMQPPQSEIDSMFK